MLGVILVHYNGALPAPLPIIGKICAIGARCPQLFFIISGFLTWKELSKKNKTIKQFYRKRFARLAPIYYVAVLISVVIPKIRILNISLGNYVSHFLFLNGLNPEWINSIMGVEWYIADLGLFYILSPFLFKAIHNLRDSIILFVISVLFSVLCLIAMNDLFSEWINNNTSYEAYFHVFFFPHQLPVMLIGVILFYVDEAIKEGKLQWFKTEAACVSVTFIVSILFVVCKLNKRLMTSSLIAGLIFGCLFLLFSRMKICKLTLWRPMVWIGRKSYGIYCFHQCLINSIILLPISKEGILVWMFMAIMTIVSSCVIGYAAEYIQAQIKSRVVHR